MADGSVKEAGDICVDDEVMGWSVSKDGPSAGPATVSNVMTGYDKLYNIRLLGNRGGPLDESFTVTSRHKLALVDNRINVRIVHSLERRTVTVRYPALQKYDGEASLTEVLGWKSQMFSYTSRQAICYPNLEAARQAAEEAKRELKEKGVKEISITNRGEALQIVVRDWNGVQKWTHGQGTFRFGGPSSRLHDRWYASEAEATDAARSFAAEHRGRQCLWTPTVSEFLELLSKEPQRAKDFRMLRCMAVMSFEKSGSHIVCNIDQAIKLCAKPPQEGAATAEDVCYAMGLHMADGNALLAYFYIGEHETQILNFLEKFATGLGMTFKKYKPFEDVLMFTVSLTGRGGKRENMLLRIFRSMGYLKESGQKTVSDELEMNLLRQPPPSEACRDRWLH